MTRPVAPRPSGPLRAGPVLDRRSLLRTGGLALSLGAVVAACGDDRVGLEEPGRVGNAPPLDPLPDSEINDLVFLRTAQSIEYTALDVYAAAVDLGALDATASALVSRFVEDHTRHADALGELITTGGGEPFTCANPWLTDRAVTPILAAIEGSDDLARDVLNIAHALENMAGATYQLFIGMLTEPALRRSAMLIGVDEHRHAAALAMAITGTPEGYFGPEILDVEAEPDADGFPIPHAVSSTFGQLGAQDLLVGARGTDGNRFTISLQTPAENSYVYDYMSC